MPAFLVAYPPAIHCRRHFFHDLLGMPDGEAVKRGSGLFHVESS